jgi:adenylosuccinate synthase
MGDLYRSGFRSQVEQIIAAKNRILEILYPAGEFKPLDAFVIHREYAAYAERLRPHVCDTTELLLSAAEAGQNILFEGAQGALLDVDHGTYPYVTSSNSSGVGISSGSGVPMKYIERVIGVVKAYSTRVGGGPFPTEQDNATGQYLRDRGNEYGTVTRRPRRCGWLDAVALRYTTRLSGVDSIAVMLLDVLTGLDPLNVCVAYELDGKQITRFPSHVDDVRRVAPVYETLSGWQENVTDCRSLGDLPQNAQAYLRRVSELIGRPIGMVSVGREREQTIVVKKL